MKKVLLSVLAVSAMSTSINAQSNNGANANLDGYLFNFTSTKADNCPNIGVPSRDISAEYAAYASYDVTGGALVINKNGAVQTKDYESFPMLFTDESCNVTDLDFTGKTPVTISVKLNASVAAPQCLIALGDDQGNFTDNAPFLQAVNVGSQTLTATISDFKTWDSKNVDKAKIRAMVIAFRTSYDDVTAVKTITGTYSIDWIKIGDQTGLVTDGVNELSSVSNFSVFPSPATSEVNLKFTAQEATTVTLTDITGRVMVSEQVAAGSVSKTYNVSNFAQGLYFVTISGANGQTTEKFMVK
ncbi:MAG: T9SS type A sorting domain-containing protein [Flavobacteriales bacterium]